LPDWADEATRSRAGLLELEGFIACHFGLRLRVGGGFETAVLPSAKFKRPGGRDTDDLTDARRFATTVAGLIARATAVPWVGDAMSANGVRSAALRTSRHRWVDFEALVEASWEMGVPVVYLPDIPGKPRKPEGMVTFAQGRPVVVLMKNQPIADWMSFILAHELGHIGRGHLGTDEGAAVVDVSTFETEADVEEDVQESEANGFAQAVLGDPLNLKNWPPAAQLATDAIHFGSKECISPGYAVLNAVRHTTTHGKNLWPLVHATLKTINERLGNKPTADICRDAMQRHVDMNAVKPDTLDFLEKLKVL